MACCPATFAHLKDAERLAQEHGGGSLKHLRGPHPHVTFVLHEDGFGVEELSEWEHRNLGLMRIMDAAFPLLRARPAEPCRVKVFTADRMCDHQGRASLPHDTLVFQTVCHRSQLGSSTAAELFPEHTFGGWWHIGLDQYDAFCEDVAAHARACVLEADREPQCFWTGNVAMHDARARFQQLASQSPDRLLCRAMTWVTPYEPTPFTHTRDFARFRYLIDLQAAGWSGRLVTLPWTRRPLLVQDREWWSWAHAQLLAHNDCSPSTAKVFELIDADFSNLHSTLDRLDADPSQAEAMAERCFAFAREHWSLKAAAQHAADLISARISPSQESLSQSARLRRKRTMWPIHH